EVREVARRQEGVVGELEADGDEQDRDEHGPEAELAAAPPAADGAGALDGGGGHRVAPSGRIASDPVMAAITSCGVLVRVSNTPAFAPRRSTVTRSATS